MENQKDIFFIVITSSAVILLLIFALADLLLIGRNRRLRHRNELLELNVQYEQELLVARHEATEEVFNDVAAELHDNIGQTLTLAVIHLNRMEMDNTGPAEQLNETRDIIRQAMQDIRQLSHHLSSNYLLHFSLAYNIGRLRERLTRMDSYSLDFDIRDTPAFASRNHELILVRILQELISNTLKHAQASHISLRVGPEAAGVRLYYTDNGIGFNDAVPSEGMGVRSIRQRLHLLNATWEYRGIPGKGTVLEALIPTH